MVEGEGVTLHGGGVVGGGLLEMMIKAKTLEVQSQSV